MPKRGELLGELARRLAARQPSTVPMDRRPATIRAATGGERIGELVQRLLGTLAEQPVGRVTDALGFTGFDEMANRPAPQTSIAMMPDRPGAKLGDLAREVTKRQRMPSVRAAIDNPHDVGAATFNAYEVTGNRTVPMDALAGGVRMDDPREAQRVQDLVKRMTSDRGYVSRPVVSDAGTVLEGQHRIEALRQMGMKNAPVVQIKDLSHVHDAVKATRTIHNDQIPSLIQEARRMLRESGTPDQAMADWEIDPRHSAAFMAAMDAMVRP